MGSAPARPLHVPVHPVRFVTATSLFDGHDAAITIMRRLLQAQGAEVVHLGHNRSVEEVVAAVVEEDVQGVAVSSYQGGHLEYFRYLVDRLDEVGRGDVAVYGGGGGVIVPPEITALEAHGVRRIFSPADGQRLGLGRMVNLLIEECDVDLAARPLGGVDDLHLGDVRVLARTITTIEAGRLEGSWRSAVTGAARARGVPVLGITGTGGAGKSSLTDELLRRFRLALGEKLRIAVLAVDPTRRRTGGALLGDRIRMNAVSGPDVYVRSLATRGASSELPGYLPDVVDACAAAGFDLVVVETPGIGQGDAAVAPVADVALYVMTPEFGAATQLEKIDMVELADAVAVNKCDRRGAGDAVRAVTRQWGRTRPTAGAAGSPDAPPVFGTVASRFNDPGTTSLAHWLLHRLAGAGLFVDLGAVDLPATRGPVTATPIVPPERDRYLAEITETVRRYHRDTHRSADAARRAAQARGARIQALEAAGSGTPPAPELVAALDALVARAEGEVDTSVAALLDEFRQLRSERDAGVGARPPADSDCGATADADADADTADTDLVPVPLSRRSLAGTPVPRVALPRLEDDGDLVRWLRSEHLPGHFPYTAGVFPTRHQHEDPARMFAGEGDPARTNRRFHLLAGGQPATRLSVAFDSVTLYGRDPGTAPDVYGKVGTSGVSVATLDDMADLFAGFDLCDPATSVSMTINGPAPAVLAMFLNVAVDQQLDRFVADHGRSPEPAEAAEIRDRTLRVVRGTVQADILKEDQGQNTCIFSTEFSLRVMGDIQQYFVDHGVANFYSVSVSGYHIAEAGANPVTQLAFTLANGFTYLEAYLARGMSVDDVAGNFSFFFSNGMDPEYTVIGRVARRIWAVALRDRYGAGPRAQRLKYHVQTSGRSLHAQEMAFNDIRTTLQALCAVQDNANSLHTNAYDEAVTTPTPESVRRALAIQLIINREWGATANENPLQGSFFVEELTDLVEEAVLAELDRLAERGGVLGAMETGYQRGRIQDDSLRYEEAKHDGSLPVVGVNTFIAAPGGDDVGGDRPAPAPDRLARATEEEKAGQVRRLGEFHRRHASEAPAALAELRRVALEGGNVFATLMDTVRHASLGQITDALFDVGGVYRRTL